MRTDYWPKNGNGIEVSGSGLSLRDQINHDLGIALVVDVNGKAATKNPLVDFWSSVPPGVCVLNTKDRYRKRGE
jgi:hypothetical protein